MTQTPKRGPYAKTAARRQQILRAARESFVERGVDGSSLRDIAARAGMTHAGLLHHYGSRDELLVAVLEQRDAEEQERSSSPPTVAGANGPRSTGGATDSFLAQLLREHQAEPELMRLWAELTAAASRADHPAHDYFTHRYARTRALMASHLRRRAQEGALRDHADPDRVATLLAAVLDGLQTQWLLDQELPLHQLLDHFLGLVLEPGQALTASELPAGPDRA